MHYLPIPSICFVFFSHVVTSPLDPRALSSRTSVFQTVRKSSAKSGSVALASLYRKYNSKVSQHLEAPEDVSRAANSNDGSVESVPGPYDVEYLSPVVIGGQSLNLAFDTGSADLYVFRSLVPIYTRLTHINQLGFLIQS